VTTIVPAWPKTVKSFATEKAAEGEARKYDHARAFNGYKPLYVEQTGEDEWTVFNPGYAVARSPIPRREPIPRG